MLVQAENINPVLEKSVAETVYGLFHTGLNHHDTAVYSSHLGTIPVAAVWKMKLLFPLFLFKGQ